MKIHRSKFNETIEKIGKSPVRVRVSCKDGSGNDNVEGLYVARDWDHRVQYLMNAPVFFMPMNAWGLEFKIGETDLYKYRGKDFDETEFSVVGERYDQLVENGWLDPETDEFFVEKYLEDVNKEK